MCVFIIYSYIYICIIYSYGYIPWEHSHGFQRVQQIPPGHFRQRHHPARLQRQDPRGFGKAAPAAGVETVDVLVISLEYVPKISCFRCPKTMAGKCSLFLYMIVPFMLIMYIYLFTVSGNSHCHV